MTFIIEASPTIPASITMVGQGRKQTLNVVFRHKTIDEYDEMAEQLRAGKITATDFLLLLLDSWDANLALDSDGVGKLIQHQPGADMAIVQAFGLARQVAAEKN